MSKKSLLYLFNKLAQVILFLLLAYCYLYIGYHTKEHVFDFNTFQFVLNEGVNSSEYVQNLADISTVLTKESRWTSAIFSILSLSLLSSAMIWVFFKKRKYFYISLVYYSVLLTLCGCYIFLFSLFSHSDLGYQIARFVKDNFIHTPFVFVILVASLKVFKI